MKKGSEESEQILFVNWVHRNHPEFWPWLHHSPNGGKRHISVAQKFKLMGVKKGFPDLVCFKPTKNWVGLVIELKTETGKPSVEQKAWLAYFESLGYLAELAVGCAGAIEIFEEYVA